MALKDLEVVQSNQLTQAGQALTVNEKRVLLSAAAQIDSSKRIPESKVFHVHAAEFADAFGLEGKYAYQALFEGSEGLFKREVLFYGPSGKVRKKIRWVSSVTYHEGEARISLSFTGEIAPYLSALQNQITKYQLRDIGKLTSLYAMRLYEVLAQFRDAPSCEIPLEQLRAMLVLGDKYTDVKNLRVRVLEPAIGEINASTDFSVTWRAVRHGRKVVAIRFELRQVPQRKLALEAAA